MRPKFDGRVGRRIPIKCPVNNFGDLIGPLVVRLLLEQRGVDKAAGNGRRLFSVGSVLHFADTGDTVWGTGVNGKACDSQYRWSALDVRAVRGPRTHAFVAERGVNCPEVYGDPALLLPALMPQLREWADEPKRHRITVVPNFNDLPTVGGGSNVLDPRSPLMDCLERIARSELVVGSSLHALIVAESVGVPARAARSETEPELKYRDYYEGTGRTSIEIANSSSAAIEMGGATLPRWDAQPLLDAFPYDLWSAGTAGPTEIR